MTPKEALDLSFYCGDLDEVVTIREYMQELLKRLFEEGEGFSGKRPLGNSGWQHDLEVPLVMHGAIPGTFRVHDDEGEEVPNDQYDIDMLADHEQSVDVEIADDFDGYDDFIEKMIDAL